MDHLSANNQNGDMICKLLFGTEEVYNDVSTASSMIKYLKSWNLIKIAIGLNSIGLSTGNTSEHRILYSSAINSVHEKH